MKNVDVFQVYNLLLNQDFIDVMIVGTTLFANHALRFAIRTTKINLKSKKINIKKLIVIAIIVKIGHMLIIIS